MSTTTTSSPAPAPAATAASADRRAGTRWAFWGLALAFLTVTAGGTLPIPLWGPYADTFGFSTDLVVVVFAAYSVGTLAALLLFGTLSDLIGRRPVALAGIGLGAASSALFLLADGIAILIVARVLSGLSVATVAAAATAYLVELQPSGHRATATRVATAANLGGLGVGPLLAGVLAESAAHPLRLSYWVHIGLLLVAALLVLRAPETVETRGSFSLRPHSLHVPEAMRSLFVTVAIAVTAVFAVFGLFSAVPGRFVSDELGSESLLLIGVTVFAMFTSASVAQLFVVRLGAARAMLIGLTVLPAGLGALVLALATTSVVLFVLSAVLAGVGGGLSFVGGMSQLNHEAPEERRGEVVASILLVAYSSLSVPVLGLALATQFVSFPTGVYGFAAAVTVLALLSATALWRRR